MLFGGDDAVPSGRGANEEEDEGEGVGWDEKTDMRNGNLTTHSSRHYPSNIYYYCNWERSARILAPLSADLFDFLNRVKRTDAI